MNAETLRLLLVREGLWQGKRRRKKHRTRRERRACLGELLQTDGSEHDWFEGRGPRCVLMVAVDDATSRSYCRFFESETTAAAFETFGAWCRAYGVPRALYVDRDSIYRCERKVSQATVEEELRGEGPETQFGRAMRLLGVELILANSPQAQGRVERSNGTLQDQAREGDAPGRASVTSPRPTCSSTGRTCALQQEVSGAGPRGGGRARPAVEGAGGGGQGREAGRGAVLGGPRGSCRTTGACSDATASSSSATGTRRWGWRGGR